MGASPEALDTAYSMAALGRQGDARELKGVGRYFGGTYLLSFRSTPLQVFLLLASNASTFMTGTGKWTYLGLLTC
jgi:hypothetical protein